MYTKHLNHRSHVLSAMDSLPCTELTGWHTEKRRKDGQGNQRLFRQKTRMERREVKIPSCVSGVRHSWDTIIQIDFVDFSWEFYPCSEVEFLDVIGTKVLQVFLLAFHRHI
jgi:hypothetical protein